MAEEAFTAFEEQLRCTAANCSNIYYTDPKLLQCTHIFCQSCLEVLGATDHHGKLFVICPTCSEMTPLPISDRVADLQSANHIDHLLAIQDSLNEIKGFTDQKEYCSIHEERELEYYCNCGEVICIECGVKSRNGKHHNHKLTHRKEEFVTVKKEILSSLEPVKIKLAGIKFAVTEIGQHYSKVSQQSGYTKAEIKRTFDDLHRLLTDREQQLIGQLEKVTEEKLDGLEAQKEQIERIQGQMDNCLNLISKSIEAGNQGDMHMLKLVIEKKMNITKNVKELATTFNSDILTPIMDDDIEFLHSTTECGQYGQVLVQSLPDPTKCRKGPNISYNFRNIYCYPER